MSGKEQRLNLFIIIFIILIANSISAQYSSVSIASNKAEINLLFSKQIDTGQGYLDQQKEVYNITITKGALMVRDNQPRNRPYLNLVE